MHELGRGRMLRLVRRCGHGVARPTRPARPPQYHLSCRSRHRQRYHSNGRRHSGGRANDQRMKQVTQAAVCALTISSDEVADMVLSTNEKGEINAVLVRSPLTGPKTPAVGTP